MTQQVLVQHVYPYLVILDWKEDKAVRILLEQRLIGFLRLNCWRNDRNSYSLFFRLADFEKGILDVKIVGYWRVVGYILFPDSLEVEFFSWRVHLEVLDSRGSLARECVSIDTKGGGRVHSVAGDCIPSLKA